VVSLLSKCDWAAHCEKPGVRRRSTTCIILAQQINLNLNNSNLLIIEF
jgi:hypothetical protein